MNLLSVLQPSPEARTIHRRLGYVLECQRFELLQAKANIWEPGETPEPRKPGVPKAPREPKDPIPPTVDRVYAILSDRPMSSGQIAMRTNCNGSTTKNALTWLTRSGRVVNLSRPGQRGMFVRAVPAADKPRKGPFDV